MWITKRGSAEFEAYHAAKHRLGSLDRGRIRRHWRGAVHVRTLAVLALAFWVAAYILLAARTSGGNNELNIRVKPQHYNTMVRFKQILETDQ